MTPAEPVLIAAPPAPPLATARARGLIEGQQTMLTRLAEIGMEIAEQCGRDAAAMAAHTDDQAASRRDPAVAFARVARAVRLTIALQQRLAKDLAALDNQDEWTERDRRRDRRTRLSHLVQEAAEVLVTARRKAEGGADEQDAAEIEIDRMSDAAYERLTEAEDGWLMGRPFNEVVAHICRDLGLSPDRAARLMATVKPPAPPDPPLPPPQSGGRGTIGRRADGGGGGPPEPPSDHPP